MLREDAELSGCQVFVIRKWRRVEEQAKGTRAQPEALIAGVILQSKLLQSPKAGGPGMEATNGDYDSLMSCLHCNSDHPTDEEIAEHSERGALHSPV